MTKSLTRYQCGICKEEYEHEEAAQACEAKGVAISYTRGTIFKNKDDDAPRVWAVCADKACAHLHMNPFDVWVMYDRPGPHQPDIVPNKGWPAAHMGPFIAGKLGEFDAITNPNDVALLRMVTALTDARIPPLVWNGREAIPYLEWLSTTNHADLLKGESTDANQVLCDPVG